eukprot:TRINITY_DN18449_c0_g1_i2.p1 TRINITY_DN18449_c0_g1~~TRINITY_DN18449_c0_g1_i2.p1  ORF type:complete len:967 (+),score=345.91 TRINITY_DN18449_c0_g1_i2:63-2963(+)
MAAVGAPAASSARRTEKPGPPPPVSRSALEEESNGELIDRVLALDALVRRQFERHEMVVAKCKHAIYTVRDGYHAVATDADLREGRWIAVVESLQPDHPHVLRYHEERKKASDGVVEWFPPAPGETRKGIDRVTEDAKRRVAQCVELLRAAKGAGVAELHAAMGPDEAAKPAVQPQGGSQRADTPAETGEPGAGAREPAPAAPAVPLPGAAAPRDEAAEVRTQPAGGEGADAQGQLARDEAADAQLRTGAEALPQPPAAPASMPPPDGGSEMPQQQDEPAAPYAQQQEQPAATYAQQQEQPAGLYVQQQQLPAGPYAQQQQLPAVAYAQQLEQPAGLYAQQQHLPAAPYAWQRDQPAAPYAQQQQLPAAPYAQQQQLPAAPYAQQQQLPAAAYAQQQEQHAGPYAQQQQLPAAPYAQQQHLPAALYAQQQHLPAALYAQQQQLPSAPYAQQQQLPAGTYAQQLEYRTPPLDHYAPPLEHQAPPSAGYAQHWEHPAPLSVHNTLPPAPALFAQQLEWPAYPLGVRLPAPSPSDVLAAQLVLGPAQEAQIAAARLPARSAASAEVALAECRAQLTSCQLRAQASEARARSAEAALEEARAAWSSAREEYEARIEAAEAAAADAAARAGDAELGLGEVGEWAQQLLGLYWEEKDRADREEETRRDAGRTLGPALQQGAEAEQRAARLQEQLQRQQAEMPPCLWQEGLQLVWKGRGGEGPVYAVDGSAGDLAVKIFTNPVGINATAATTAAVRSLGHRWECHLALPSEAYRLPCVCGGHCILTYAAYDGDLVAAAQEVTVDLVDALEVFRGLLRGAAVLHQAGHAHGDVKSPNVLAKWRQGGKVDHIALGDVGGVLQTAAWLPPDRVGSAAAPDTDVYAAALVFIDVCTGCRGPLPPDERTADGVRAALQGLRLPPGGPRRAKAARRAAMIEKATGLAMAILGPAPPERLDAAAALALVDGALQELAAAP